MESRYDGVDVATSTFVLLNCLEKNCYAQTIAIAFSSLLLNAIAYADSSCQAQATEKKLSGAANNSFVKKCEKNAAGG